ncbi:hypothetical protein NE237_014152 [Protea cynaroides]|uniref:Uncharacterized protein n=1 Tax=Protea cynaroides TaxID=273540 RepID=A0A9Q0JQQ0_9MAGN|nr:hypothetical protein NE237_014152 [Protea cynaroides]
MVCKVWPKKVAWLLAARLNALGKAPALTYKTGHRKAQKRRRPKPFRCWGAKEIFLPLLSLLCLPTATRPDATYVIDVGGSRSSTYFRRGAFFISISINIYTWMCCYFNKGLKELIQPSKRRHSSRRPEKDSISFSGPTLTCLKAKAPNTHPFVHYVPLYSRLIHSPSLTASRLVLEPVVCRQRNSFRPSLNASGEKEGRLMIFPTSSMIVLNCCKLVEFRQNSVPHGSHAKGPWWVIFYHAGSVKPITQERALTNQPIMLSLLSNQPLRFRFCSSIKSRSLDARSSSICFAAVMDGKRIRFIAAVAVQLLGSSDLFRTFHQWLRSVEPPEALNPELVGYIAEHWYWKFHYVDREFVEALKIQLEGYKEWMRTRAGPPRGPRRSRFRGRVRVQRNPKTKMMMILPRSEPR